MSQEPIIKAMQRLGYKSDEGGVCFGLVHVHNQMLMAGRTDEFWATVDKLCNDPKTQDSLTEIAEYLQDKTSGKRLTGEQWALLAFLENIEVIFRHHEYSQLVSSDNPLHTQNAERSFELYKPQSEDEVDNGPKKVGSLALVYDQTTMNSFFAQMRNVFYMQTPELESPLEVTLSGSGVRHIIAITYNKSKNKWEIMDPNWLPDKIECRQNDLANELRAFLGEPLIFAANIFARNSDNQEQNKLITDRFDELKKWNNQQAAKHFEAHPADKSNSSDLIYALHRSAASDDLDATKILLEECNKKNIDFNSDFSILNYTPLNTAIELGNQKITEALLKYSNNPNIAVNQTGDTPLYMATVRGDKDLFNFLIEQPGINLKVKNSSDVTLLHCAASSGQMQFAEFLVDKGLEIDAKDKLGRNALSYAVAKGHTHMAQWLLEKKGSEIVVDNAGGSLLHLAVTSSQQDTVKYLLMRGGLEVNAKDANGFSPLHLAAMDGDAELVKLLLDNPEIDINAKNNTGMTPLHVAANNGHAAVIKLLLDNADIDINAKDGDDLSPIQLAVAFGHIDAVTLLLANKKTDLSPDPDGTTLLHVAIQGGNKEVMQLLLDRNVTDIAVNSEGLSLIHYAAGLAKPEMVKLLINKLGINQCSSEGVTPLQKAVALGQTDIVKSLLDIPGIEFWVLANKTIEGKLPSALHMAMDIKTESDPAAAKNRDEIISLLLDKYFKTYGFTNDTAGYINFFQWIGGPEFSVPCLPNEIYSHLSNLGMKLGFFAPPVATTPAPVVEQVAAPQSAAANSGVGSSGIFMALAGNDKTKVVETVQQSIDTKPTQDHPPDVTKTANKTEQPSTTIIDKQAVENPGVEAETPPHRIK